MTNYNDDEAAKFYEDPKNRPPSGKPVRQNQPRKPIHGVYVSPAIIERIKPLADEMGITVGNWIRMTIDRELRRSEKRPTT